LIFSSLGSIDNYGIFKKEDVAKENISFCCLQNEMNLELI